MYTKAPLYLIVYLIIHGAFSLVHAGDSENVPNQKSTLGNSPTYKLHAFLVRRNEKKLRIFIDRSFLAAIGDKSDTYGIVTLKIAHEEEETLKRAAQIAMGGPMKLGGIAPVPIGFGKSPESNFSDPEVSILFAMRGKKAIEPKLIDSMIHNLKKFNCKVDMAPNSQHVTTAVQLESTPRKAPNDPKPKLQTFFIADLVADTKDILVPSPLEETAVKRWKNQKKRPGGYFGRKTRTRKSF